MKNHAESRFKRATTNCVDIVFMYNSMSAKDFTKIPIRNIFYSVLLKIEL